MSNRQYLSDVEFAENPEPRCACVLLLDTSGSMEGPPINELNKGLKALKDSLLKDTQASKRVEIAIVTYNDTVDVIQDFITIDGFNSPVLTASGSTSMGAGIIKSLSIIETRKQQYKSNGISYYRPWLFMITDGFPTDTNVIDEAMKQIKNAESKKQVAFFAIGVEDADMERLKQISVRDPVKLKGLNFSDMFVWLSRSMSKVSSSKTDEQISLPPIGWASI